MRKAIEDIRKKMTAASMNSMILKFINVQRFYLGVLKDFGIFANKKAYGRKFKSAEFRAYRQRV